MRSLGAIRNPCTSVFICGQNPLRLRVFALKHLGAKVATTTSAGNAELVRSLGGDVVIDYQKQKFEEVLRDYDAVLGTVPGKSLEKSFQILKPTSTVISLVGPPDA